MAGFRRIILRSICNSRRSPSIGATDVMKSIDRKIHGGSLLGQSCGGSRTDIRCMGSLMDRRVGILSSQFSTLGICCYKPSSVRLALNTPLNLGSRYSFRLFSAAPFLNHRSYSSSSGDASEDSMNQDLAVRSSASDGGVIGNEWMEKIREAWEFASGKTVDLFNDMNPPIQLFLDANPYLKKVIVPVSSTVIGTILAWVVMPRVLRKLHTYAMRGPATLIYGSSAADLVPYEKSFWGALEEPVRYMITFMAFAQLAVIAAPATIASQYIGQAWRGALILSFIWFLHRWKTNMFSRALASQNLAKLDRQKLLALDKVSSVGIFAVGSMALAEACGVAVQSVLTVGGVGGVATAFAARDILGNVLSGLSMQFTQPFSLGDTIKAGSIEGQVVEMGLTTTSLLNFEKSPVTVPNSFFLNQAIVNKSRSIARAIVTKIPLNVDDLDKLPVIKDAIEGMLRSNSKIFLEKEPPYCFLTQIENSCAELTLGCNLKYMTRAETAAAQQDILLKSVEIIKHHGGSLGSFTNDRTSP